MRSSQEKNGKNVISMLVLAMVFLGGCAASAPPPAIRSEAVFYPPPPELPRVQFLKSFTGAQDIESGQSVFQTFVTGETEPIKRLDKPYGVAMFEGKLYVCDSNSTVMVFDLEKKTFTALAGAKGLGKLVQPINISVDSSDGSKYVVDPVRGQIVMYDRQDFFVKAFGLPGAWKPVDAVSSGDRLYVADAKNRHVKVFDKASGKVVKLIGHEGLPEERLVMPTNLAFDRDGILYVSDPGRFQVVKYDRDGHYREKIGDPGQNPGFFSRPRGIALDRENRLFAVDAAFDNVQIFSANGQMLLFFAKAGTKPGDLFLPAKVALDYDNVKYFQEYADPNFEVEYLAIVTSQFGNSLVNVYGVGKERGKVYPTEEELRRQAEERVKQWELEHPEGVEAGEPEP